MGRSKLLARIGAIFLDLDETLLGPDHEVSARSRAAIAGLSESGVTVVLCTGRAAEASEPIVAALRLRYLICVNGACVRDLGPPGSAPPGRVLFESLLPADLVGAMGEYFHAQGRPFYLMSPRGYFVSQRTAEIEHYDLARHVRPLLLAPAEFAQPAYKVMPLGAAHLYEPARERFGDRAQVVYHPAYLEIAPAGVTKAWGAERLAAHLDIPPESCLACGDALNDIELLRWAGIGVAMGDAPAELRAAADFVTGPHTEDGCAPVLEAVLRARRP